MAPIVVFDSATDAIFERQLPAAYVFHLLWMVQEARQVTVGSKTSERRSSYLYQVLDAFAEEAKQNEAMSDWRSAVLTPLLVREYHSLNTFAPSSIEACLRGQTLHRGRLTEDHWANFYFKYDVIHPSNSRTWKLIKGATPQSTTNSQALSDAGKCALSCGTPRNRV
jgi:hypothetical protein